MSQHTIDSLIGDVPVSEQLSAALDRMATKDHIHSDYVTCEDFYELKRKVDMLVDLIGDTPISEQIYMIINNIR